MTSVPHGKSSARDLVVIGCGYVGKAVAIAGRNEGWRVKALTRNPDTAAQLRSEGIETIVADAADDSWHKELGTRPEFVLNSLSSGGGGLQGYQRSYVDGMRSVVRWLAKIGGTERVVYTSSTSVYPQDGGVTVDELAPTEGGDERAQLLVAAERVLMERQEISRRWFVLRLAGIYGPERHMLLDQVRAGEVAGTGAHHLNLVHRDDIVSAIMACFATPSQLSSQVFNVADDSAATKREVTDWLAQTLGVSPPRFTGRPASGRRAVVPDRVISNARIRRVLGWSPKYRTFREGYLGIIG